MKWIHITTIEQLNEVDEASRKSPVIIFKHSTTCSISRMALDRIERAWTPANGEAYPVYFVDLWKYRAVSNAVESRYGIHHESPQLLVIEGGACVHTASHSAIRYDALMDELRRAA